MHLPRNVPFVAALVLPSLFDHTGATAADPSKWRCEREARDGEELYVCRDCGPPQPEADGLQICQVYDFTVGVEAFPTAETALVIIVTPYLVRPVATTPLLRPPDRLELQRPAK